MLFSTKVTSMFQIPQLMLKTCCFSSHILSFSISFDQNSFLPCCSCAEKMNCMNLVKLLTFQGPEFFTIKMDIICSCLTHRTIQSKTKYCMETFLETYQSNTNYMVTEEMSPILNIFSKANHIY